MPSPGSADPSAENPGDTGAVGVALQVAPGVTVNTVGYTLTGPNGFSQSGTINVSMSPTVSAIIGGLPAGSGFSLSLSGLSADGSVTCSGVSAPFAVLANQTIPVSVVLACSGPTPESGTIVVNGTTSACPTIDAISVTPANVVVGGSLTLTAAARGPNGGGLTYAWSATSGSLANATSSIATFTCTAAGTPAVTVTVTDGSDAAGCVAVQSVSVTCTQVLAVSRIRYEGNTFGNPAAYPAIFNDTTVTGVQGSIHIDQYPAIPGGARISALDLTGISTSFSSKSEGALMTSVNGQFLSYMGYNGPVGSEGVSNSYTTLAPLAGNTNPQYDREVALISLAGAVTLQPEANAYSGDNPRAAISVDGTQFYMVGNSDSTTSAVDGGTTGPGLSIGARYGTPGSNLSLQLGNYVAADRTDESNKQHVKDNNWRGVGIYNGNLYVSKGSGGNGDDGLFQVHNGTGNGLPLGTGNTITPLFSSKATGPVMADGGAGLPSPIVPFGFWFANATTVYVADEGYPNVDSSGHLIADPMAGLQKWALVGGTWQLEYILTNGLGLLQAQTPAGYPTQSYPYGLRNMTGSLNGDGTATLYAITSQYSIYSNGEPDPTSLVMITDNVAATTLPAGESFVTLQTSNFGEVFRGVSIALH